MGILSWIIFGGLAGWIASKITGHDASMGLVSNILIGIIGAVLGGLVMSLIGKTGVDGFNLGSFLVAVGGAVLLLAIFKGFRRRG
ncbi:MAG TPA: GlsB/YeaQ/YmgE family stress response membrane protein [Clostridia bacterium]|nr:GlsB/YeaQ/YmgE family stress response membrane protein [Clostridia bacterium]